MKQQKEKKKQKLKKAHNASGQSCHYQHLRYRVPRRRIERVRKLVAGIMTGNFSNLVKETDIQVQKSQSPKQDALKKILIKMHYNKSIKSCISITWIWLNWNSGFLCVIMIILMSITSRIQDSLVGRKLEESSSNHGGMRDPIVYSILTSLKNSP